jgi:hypothetical protein
MKEIAVYCYPHYVGIPSASHCAPDIFRVIKECGVEPYPEDWHGTLTSVPGTEEGPAIVRASSKMHCDEKELAALCAERGHLLISTGNFVIKADGTRTYSDGDNPTTPEVVREFIKKNC